MLTRWLSSYDEARCANENQHDLDVAIKRIKAPGEAAEKLRTDTETEVGEETDAFTEKEWELFAQYEGAMADMKSFCLHSQSMHVIAHEELFFARMTIEKLQADFFLMKENLSANTTGPGGKDLTVSVMVSQCSHCFLVRNVN